MKTVKQEQLPKGATQEPGTEKFYSKRFGFLHVCIKNSHPWYNLTDVCRTMNLTIHEAEDWINDNGCSMREFNVRRSKITSCNRYVDNDGLSTILIMCCRAIGNEYRRWISNTVLWSVAHPDQTFAIKELDDETIARLTAEQIVAHYKSVARERKGSVNGTSVELTIKDENEPTPKTEQPRQDPTVTSPKPPTKKAERKPFKPTNNHLLIEEWFRQEFPISEFLEYIDGLLGDVNKYLKKIPKGERGPVQHRVNVMTVFRKMLHANRANIKYAPTAARYACSDVKDVI